jgi:hypothetical protein
MDDANKREGRRFTDCFAYVDVPGNMVDALEILMGEGSASLQERDCESILTD